MGLMRTAATRGIIPPWMKVSELRNMVIRLTTETMSVLEERFGNEGLEAASEIFRRLGREDAQALRERLSLGGSVKDAMDSWLVLANIMGAKMHVRWVSENRAEADHSFCPQYESFKKLGKIYCEHACLPYVGAVGEGIGEGVQMELVRPADDESECIKAITFSADD
ncbi:MAG: hypothetical protein ACFFH0_07030 [Promethearchaeota archaeon]